MAWAGTAAVACGAVAAACLLAGLGLFAPGPSLLGWACKDSPVACVDESWSVLGWEGLRRDGGCSTLLPLEGEVQAYDTEGWHEPPSDCTASSGECKAQCW